MDTITTMKTKKRGLTSHTSLKEKAHRLLQIEDVPTTEVCEYIYGSKSKKSTLNQKKTGLSPLRFEESCRIIEYYGGLSGRIDKIIND